MGTQRVERPKAQGARDLPRTMGVLGSEDHPVSRGRGNKREAEDQETHYEITIDQERE